MRVSRTVLREAGGEIPPAYSPADRQLQERRQRLASEGLSRPRKGARLRRQELGKVVPYGVYDVAANAGFVSVGITSDTAEFAVELDPHVGSTAWAGQRTRTPAN